MYLNKAILIGNLTRDPELKSLPSGIQVASFGIATNRVWKDKNGAKQESADYHNIVVFGRQAETSAKFLKKGQSVLIEGRIQTRSWDSPEGKKYRTEIIAERVQFGPKAGGFGGGGGGATAAAPQKKKDDGFDEPGGDEGSFEYPQGGDINPDEIPF